MTDKMSKEFRSLIESVKKSQDLSHSIRNLTPEFLIKQDINEVSYLLKVLMPQEYGRKLQGMYALMLGGTETVPCGDFAVTNDLYEFKCSITNRGYQGLRQLRLFQKMTHYLIHLSDVEDGVKSYDTNLYKLSQNQMHRFLAVHWGSVCATHGTLGGRDIDTSIDDNVELSVTLSKSMLETLQEYRVNRSDLV